MNNSKSCRSAGPTARGVKTDYSEMEVSKSKKIEKVDSILMDDLQARVVDMERAFGLEPKKLTILMPSIKASTEVAPRTTLSERVESPDWRAQQVR